MQCMQQTQLTQQTKCREVVVVYAVCIALNGNRALLSSCCTTQMCTKTAIINIIMIKAVGILHAQCDIYLVYPCKICVHLTFCIKCIHPEPRGSYSGADLHYLSLVSDICLHCRIIFTGLAHRTVCLFM